MRLWSYSVSEVDEVVVAEVVEVVVVVCLIVWCGAVAQRAPAKWAQRARQNGRNATRPGKMSATRPDVCLGRGLVHLKKL